MSDDQYEGSSWDILFQRPNLLAAFVAGRSSVTLLWIPLREAAEGENDGRVKDALEALSAIASLHVLPDDWNAGYGPMYYRGDDRTFLPTDLADDTISLLQEVVDSVPHVLLRARVHDVIALRVTGSQRILHVRAYLEALITYGIESEGWFDERDMWHRAIETARRFGKATRQELENFESQLLRNLLQETPDNYFQAQLADALMNHGLGREKSTEVAERLRALADSFIIDPDKARVYYKAAGEWFGIGGDEGARGASYETVIRSYVAEAEALAADGVGEFARAGHLFELALRELQKVPRVDRVELGLADMAEALARRIREMGAAGLGNMQQFESEPVDLTEAARDARDRVSGLETQEALLAFAMLHQFAPVVKDRVDAEKMLQEHPLSALFSRITYSADGRIIRRSDGSGGTPVFGIDPAVWRQMVDTHVLRIQLLAAGRLWPGYETLTNEHHLTIGDFIAITANSSTIPLDHVRQFARGLYYGYIGDFSTAAQLLTMQIENFVRHHLNSGGVLTTTRTAAGTENEKGMSSLLESEKMEEIFGADLTYGLRVLHSDAAGPNLRNEIAHGLLADSTAEGATSLYAWWLALRIVYLQFWNQGHSSEATGIHDPAEPSGDNMETGTDQPEAD